jgi:hypothetical protein
LTSKPFGLTIRKASSLLVFLLWVQECILSAFAMAILEKHLNTSILKNNSLKDEQDKVGVDVCWDIFKYCWM